MSIRSIPLILILVFIMAVGGASAATIDVACGFADLQAAISTANSNAQPDTLNLAPGCTYNFTGMFTLRTSRDPNPLTINGNGATFDGNDSTSFFDVSGVTLTLNDLTLTGGRADYGAAFSVFLGDLTINNSSITGNTLTRSDLSYPGIIFGSGSIHCSTIEGNSNPGSGPDVGNSFNAPGNWWGAADGPSGAGPGSGTSVDSRVQFTPFLTAPPSGCGTAGAAGSSTVLMPPDSRINWQHGDSDAVVYPARDDAGDPALHVYCVDGDGDGYLSFAVTGADIASYPEQPAENTLIARDDACPVQFHILTTGEYQVTIGPDEAGDVRAVIFRGLPPGDVYFRDSNIYDG